MNAPPHDFACLAVIVTDWEDLYTKEKMKTSSSSSSSTPSFPILLECMQQYRIGISSIGDEIWNVMSRVVRNTIREVCLEVLRRTTLPSSPSSDDDDKNRYHLSNNDNNNDDDARFLD